MFAGLSAFPLTPMDECGIDEAAFVGLVARLAQAGVEAADGTPVMVGVGAVRTRHVLELVDDAQAAGAAALLPAPVS